MDSRVQLVFRGEVLSGFKLDDVKRHLGELFKVDGARHAHLFSGERVVIRQSLRLDEAERYTQRLAKFGALLHIEPLTVTEPAVPLSLTPAEPVPPKPASLTPVLPKSDEEIVCPNCGDRQSKRVLCRSCATNMPMGIAAKEEAERERLAAREAERRERRGAASPSARVFSGNNEASIFGFGFQGRLNRLSYATAGAWLIAGVYLLTLFFLMRPMGARMVLLGIGMLFFLFFSVRLSVLRCHDADRSGWWSLLMVVPYADLIIGLLMLLLPGTDGENDYGEQPRRGSWRWLGLALLAVVITVALTWGAAMSAMGKALANSEQEAEPVPGVSQDFSVDLPSKEAAAAYYDEYLPAPSPKAFVVSPKGGYGWKGHAGSRLEAVQEAAAACEVRRPAYTPPCRVISVDGQRVRAPER